MNSKSGSGEMAEKLMAISGTLAVIFFFIAGFAFDGWDWAWVAFLIPGMARTWVSVSKEQEKKRIASSETTQHGYGFDDDGQPKPYPYRKQ